LPVITKPASAKRLTGDGARLFALTASAADFYALFLRASIAAAAASGAAAR
jgi:hypothetical protein